MTTAREHMTADMAWLFGQDDEAVTSVLIDNTSVRAIVGEAITDRAEDGTWYEVIDLILLKGSITAPVTRQAMTLGSATYHVAAPRTDDYFLDFTLERPLA